MSRLTGDATAWAVFVNANIDICELSNTTITTLLPPHILTQLTRCVQMDAYEHRTYYYLGRHYLHIGDGTKTLKLLQRAHALAPRSDRATKALSEVCVHSFVVSLVYVCPFRHTKH
jgi:hypothetical protein